MTTRQLIALEKTRRERRELEKTHPLRQLFWECTLRCNLSCRHCGSDCRKSNYRAWLYVGICDQWCFTHRASVS